MNNEFYVESKSPAELFRGFEQEKFSMYSPEWWDRWFRWKFLCYWIDDEDGAEYYCRGLDGDTYSTDVENWLFEKYGAENVERQTRRTLSRATRIPMTRAYSSMFVRGIPQRINRGDLRFVEDPINEVTWNEAAQYPDEPGLLDSCYILNVGHSPGMCKQYDDHVGEWLGFNHSEPLDQPHQEPIFEATNTKESQS